MIVNRQIGGSGGGASGELGVPTVATSTGIVTATVTKGGVLEEGTSTTLQLSKQAAKTVTPTLSVQTAVAAGKYTTGAVKVAAVSETGYRVKTGSFSFSSVSATQTFSGLGFCPRYIMLTHHGATITNNLLYLYATAGTGAYSSKTVKPTEAYNVASDPSAGWDITFDSSGSIVMQCIANDSAFKMKGSYTYAIWGTNE